MPIGQIVPVDLKTKRGGDDGSSSCYPVGLFVCWWKCCNNCDREYIPKCPTEFPGFLRYERLRRNPGNMMEEEEDGYYCSHGRRHRLEVMITTRQQNEWSTWVHNRNDEGNCDSRASFQADDDAKAWFNTYTNNNNMRSSSSGRHCGVFDGSVGVITSVWVFWKDPDEHTSEWIGRGDASDLVNRGGFTRRYL
jgi:hypothetical protein